MNIESILKYQELDKKLFTIEQKLEKNEITTKLEELGRILKSTTARLKELDVEATKVAKYIEDIQSKYNLTKSKADEILAKDLQKLNEEELDKILTIKSKIVSNLNILEKELTKSAERVSTIVTESNKKTKLGENVKASQELLNKKLEDAKAKVQPEIERIKKELLTLEKSVDENLLAEYKRKRKDNIFPVFVPLGAGDSCGGCYNQLPKIDLVKLKEKGIITCENERCKRFIYQK